MYGSKHMDAEEIESILRIQWKSLHSGSPYQEDFYYQARPLRAPTHISCRALPPSGDGQLAFWRCVPASLLPDGADKILFQRNDCWQACVVWQAYMFTSTMAGATRASLRIV